MLTRLTCASRTVPLALILACAHLAWSQAPAATPAGKQPNAEAQVVISVGEEKMTAADVEKFLQALPPQYRAYYGGPGKQLLPQYLVQMKILAAEARKQNVQEQPE